jgi:hypothetical protein
MRPLRRPTRATIHYHGEAHGLCGSHTLTFSINGIRWEYTMSAIAADACKHIVSKASAAKALPYAKKHAFAASCLDRPTSAQATFLRHRGAQASRARRVKVTLPNV